MKLSEKKEEPKEAQEGPKSTQEDPRRVSKAFKRSPSEPQPRRGTQRAPEHKTSIIHRAGGGGRVLAGRGISASLIGDEVLHGDGQRTNTLRDGQLSSHKCSVAGSEGYASAAGPSFQHRSCDDLSLDDTVPCQLGCSDAR